MRKTCYKRRKAYAIGENFEAIEVFNRDSWVCGVCGSHIDEMLDYPNEMSATLDHVKSLSEFNDETLHLFHTRENSQPAHLICNALKGDLTLKDAQSMISTKTA